MLNQVVRVLSKSKVISIDFETTGFDWWDGNILAVGLYDGTNEFYIPFSTLDHYRSNMQLDMFKQYREKHKITVQKFAEVFKPIFDNPDISFVASNIKFDLEWASVNGIEIEGPIFDTRGIQHLLNERENTGLDDLVYRHFGRNKITYKRLTAKEPYWELDDKIAADYCLDDAVSAYDILYILLDIYEKKEYSSKLLVQEMKLIKVLKWMEMNGIRVDVEYANKFVDEYRTKVFDASEKTISLIGKKVNLNSSQQLKTVLLEQLKLPDLNSGKMDKHTWKKWKIQPNEKMVEIGKAMEEYSRLKSLLKFVDPDKKRSILSRMTGDNYIHPSFSYTSTTIGRLSCLNPNLQNLPREEQTVRGCFIPSDGYILYNVDYNQIELRCIAHYSKDEKMMAAFSEGSKVDIHEITRQAIEKYLKTDNKTEQRVEAKGVNFGIWYGLQEYNLAITLGIDTSISRRIILNVFDTYPQAKEWVDKVREWVMVHKFVKNIFGRYRRFYDIDFDDLETGMREFLLREAVHFLPSSTAADIMKIAMLRLYNKYHKEDLVRLLLQVHDELLLEIHESVVDEVVPEINKIMIKPIKKAPLRVPLEVSGKLSYRWEKN